MKNKIVKISIALALILTMVIVDIISLGSNVILAIYEELEEQDTSTNVRGVKFDAYLQTEQGNKHSKQILVNNQDNLIIDIKVEEYGVLEETKIQIENANFRIDKENLNLENIKSINTDSNEIQLDKLAAGNMKIILPIKFEKNDAKTSDYLDRETYVKISGQYKNNDVDIQNLDSNKKVRVMWTADTNVNVTQEVEKYVNLGDNGILLQEKVSVNVENGLLPVEKISMKIKVPQIEGNMPNKFVVLHNGVKLDETKVKLNKTDNNLEITHVANNEKINWGAEEFKIIYTYSKEMGYVVRTIESVINAQIKLYTKDEVQKDDSQNLVLESKGNVVTTYKNNTSNIYKGYMYANVERQVNYAEILNLEVSNIDVLQNEITMTEESNFVNANDDKYSTNQSVIYKTIKVNKENMLDILGQEGSIQIQNEEGKTIGILNKDVDTYTFETKSNYAKIVMSKPVKEGKITLSIDKALDGKTGYTKEQLKQFVVLQDTTNVVNNVEQLSVVKNIELKDTNLEMKLETNKNDLTALEKNTDVELRLTLLTNNETQELYKNPKFELQFPPQIKNIEVKQINLLHEENISLVSANMRNTDEGKKIEIQAQGEQLDYKTELQNTIVSIIADIEVINPESNIQEKIKVNTINNDKLVQEEVGINICTVQEEIIQSQETQIDFNLSATVGEDTLEDGDILNEGEVIKYKLQFTNKEDIDLENLQIKFTIPENTKRVIPYEGEEGFEYTGDIYYEELNDTEIVETIEKVEKGQTIIKEYEVRVSQNTENKEVESKAEIIYEEKTITSNTRKNKIENSELRVSVKQTTDRDHEFQEQDTITYYIIVENLSNQEQKNVVVLPKIPENTSWGEIIVKEYLEDEEIDEEYIEEIPENGQVTLESIKANGTKVVEVTINIDTVDENVEIPVMATVKSDTQSMVRSNVYVSKAIDVNIGFKMSADNGDSIKLNDEFSYIIEISNDTDIDFEDATLVDAIPEELNVLSVERNGQNILNYNQGIEELFSLNKGEKVTYKIKVQLRDEIEEELTNIATLVVGDQEYVAEVKHQFDNNQETEGDSTGSEDTDIEENNKEYYISGKVWLDENENGRRENEEELVKGIRAILIDAFTSDIAKDKEGKQMITQTDEKGYYKFENLKDGEYIVFLEYDNTLYKLTQYQKEGTNEAYNSDVIAQEMNINNEKKVYAMTDTLVIKENNISNIDMGLLDTRIFNLSLEKTVSKITLNTKNESKNYEYVNTSLAKVEIDAKKIDKTEVLIEYQLKVKNTGDMAGYVGQLVDIIPQGLDFDSELNPDWYEDNGKIYNKEIENKKINPEQETVVTLILRKVMTSEDTGIISNTAELKNCYARDGIQENVQKEDNKSQADAILTIRTGWITYIRLCILTIGILGVGIYFIRKKVLI